MPFPNESVIQNIICETIQRSCRPPILDHYVLKFRITISTSRSERPTLTKMVLPLSPHSFSAPEIHEQDGTKSEMERSVITAVARDRLPQVNLDEKSFAHANRLHDRFLIFAGRN